MAADRGTPQPRRGLGVHLAGGVGHPRLLDLPADRLPLYLDGQAQLLSRRRRAEVRRPRQLRQAHRGCRPHPPAGCRRFDDSGERGGPGGGVRPVRLPALSLRHRTQPHHRRIGRPPGRGRHRRRPCVAGRQHGPDEWTSGNDRRHHRLRRLRRRRPVPTWTWSCSACRAAPSGPALLPSRLSAADDDHARRCRLPVPDAHRHEQGPAVSAVGALRPDRRLLGDESLGRPAGGDDR